MSTYLDMWQKIKELNEQETLDWINAVEPAKGISIDFRGVRVHDTDILEALRNYLSYLEALERNEKRQYVQADFSD